MKIWRYVDLPKFVSMLATRTLHFAPVSSFEDPYEGWLPRSYMEAMVNLTRTLLDEQRQLHNHLIASKPSIDRAQLENIIRDAERKLHMPQIIKDLNKKSVRAVGTSMKAKSEAMWRLYGPAGAGIAIEFY